LVLVLGKNLVVLFVGWEGVGLASYLLIGFWFEDREKTAAGLKAFVVNRVGDTGFILGAFLVYNVVGSLDFQDINAFFALAGDRPSAAVTTAIGVLLLIGACGKSAQIPLHVWLPDAMAGPTPVSALIHAATMVTAGVYLLARLSGLYLASPAAMTTVAWVGALTALLGATMAVTQFNLKKVLAYSTISQIGLMVMACGLGAFSVGLFHLATHAFFKAGLFLGAGAVLHALGGEEDMRYMGALAKKLPFTFVTFLVATLALCGIPPFAGFFSKDEILWNAWSAANGSRGLWLVDTSMWPEIIKCTPSRCLLLVRRLRSLRHPRLVRHRRSLQRLRQPQLRGLRQPPGLVQLRALALRRGHAHSFYRQSPVWPKLHGRDAALRPPDGAARRPYP